MLDEGIPGRVSGATMAAGDRDICQRARRRYDFFVKLVNVDSMSEQNDRRCPERGCTMEGTSRTETFYDHVTTVYRKCDW